MTIGLNSFLWNFQTGATGYITDVSESTYTLLTINGEFPVELVINQTDVTPDGIVPGNWWGLSIYIGARPANFPPYGSIIVALFNALGVDPPNTPSPFLDVMTLSQPLSRNEYKTVYGFLAFDADPSTAIGVLTSSLDGMRGVFLPLNPLFYDVKVVAEGDGP